MGDPLLNKNVTMGPHDRRSLLGTVRNPDSKLEYVSSLSGQMTPFDGDQRSGIFLRYVPDRLILDPPSFARYLDAMGALEWPSLEEAAATLLNDVSNELVARWVQVSITAPPGIHAGIDSHDVLLEDRQPNWDNAGLLARLSNYRTVR